MIYVASSWRNLLQPAIVVMLRRAGHQVYDFRNPAPGQSGFNWREIDPNWQQWTPAQYREALKHPIALAGFKADLDGNTSTQALHARSASMSPSSCSKHANRN